MGIDYDSALFVGAYFPDINISQEELDDLIDNENIVRISTYYDAPTEFCYFGEEVTCEELLADGGVERVKRLITKMNELFKTDQCTLMHSPNIW